MQHTTINYHKAALGYLENYYQAFVDENFYLGYPSINELVGQGKNIAKAMGLIGMDYENALLIVSFRFAGDTLIRLF